MTELSIAQITQWRKRKRTITLTIICSGYLLIAIFLIWFFNRDQAKAGFSRLGAVGMIAVFLGAFHLADRCKRGWVFLLIGGLGGMLLVPLYTSDIQLGYSGHFSETVSLYGWIIFILATTLTTRFVAIARWKLVKDLPTESPRCINCGYDLRASAKICPECGRPFDSADENTYVSRIRKWEYGRLIRGLLIASLLTIVPVAIVFIWLYTHSEYRRISAIERMGGRVAVQSDLPEQWQDFARLLDWIISHAATVDLTGVPNITDTQLVCLQGMPHIWGLDLGWTSIRGAGLANVVGNDQLTRLGLAYTQLDDAGLVNISRFKNLSDLDLTSTPITDAGVPQLLQLSKLWSLKIDGTGITEQGLEKLINICSLHYVSATHLTVTEEQWRNIQKEQGDRRMQIFCKNSFRLGLGTLSIQPATQP